VDRAASLVKGYATAVTDTGHQNLNNADASFALTAPGVRNTAALADYYYRAAHEVTVGFKLLLPRFYGAASVKRAYFDGCSNGGRMAFEAAKHYPADYDGIIAGAPVPSQRQILLLHKGALSNLEPISARMPVEMLPVIDAAVYASCDAADGVSDGLIQNPALCSFDPQTLVCPGGNAASCLTQDQANGLKNYLRPLTDEQGRVLTPAHSVTDLAGGTVNYTAYALGPNAPSDPNGPEPWGSGPMARGWSLGDTTLKYIVYLDPNFNSRTFPIRADGRIDDDAIAKYDAATADGTVSPADLAAFIGTGRKMIIYHGFADHALSPFTTMQFYAELAQRMQGHYEKLGEHVRLFHGAGDAALRRWPRSEHLRHAHRARDLGRARHGTGQHHGHPRHGRRRRPLDAAVHVPPAGPLPRPRERQRRGKLVVLTGAGALEARSGGHRRGPGPRGTGSRTG